MLRYGGFTMHKCLWHFLLAYALLTGIIIGSLIWFSTAPTAQPSLDYESSWLGVIPDKAIDFDLSGKWILTKYDRDDSTGSVTRLGHLEWNLSGQADGVRWQDSSGSGGQLTKARCTDTCGDFDPVRLESGSAYLDPTGHANHGVLCRQPPRAGAPMSAARC